MAGVVDDLPARSLDVVVVDDDTFVLERVKRSLRDTNWTVTGFLKVEDALTHLRHSGAPRVLIVDNRMPRLDGVDFLEQLALDPAVETLQVYLCSGVRPPPETRERVVRLGARLLDKDVLCDRQAFLDLLERDCAA